MKKIRCAIYTRKSAEEGLEQDFNSLDAQREACAAYVASQKAEGWVLLPTVYEDAGISGGTLERPSLQRLLADIDAGLVGQIVVYKVDRLTRSREVKILMRLPDARNVAARQAIHGSAPCARTEVTDRAGLEFVCVFGHDAHAACDVAGAGNELTVRLVRHSHRKRGETDRPRLRSTAPALDPTDFQ